MVDETPLRFIDSGRVDTPAGALHDIVIVSPTDAKLGTLDGVVVHPTTRQVRYYVVKARHRFTTHRYLLPVMPAQLLADRGELRVDLEPEDLVRLPEAHPQAFPPFGDADVLDAVFSRRVQ